MPVSDDYFGNRLKEYELTLYLELNRTRGYDKTVWPYNGAPTEANAGYSLSFNSIRKHCVIGQDFLILYLIGGDLH